ncbi:MAG: hypothetical protein LBQ40_03600 [Clostridiales bacterium]|jgi:hypothetical protein|nr:hypothetical protein [Clostridiales bacterium]
MDFNDLPFLENVKQMAAEYNSVLKKSKEADGGSRGAKDADAAGGASPGYNNPNNASNGYNPNNAPNYGNPNGNSPYNNAADYGGTGYDNRDYPPDGDNSSYNTRGGTRYNNPGRANLYEKYGRESPYGLYIEELTDDKTGKKKYIGVDPEYFGYSDDELAEFENQFGVPSLPDGFENQSDLPRPGGIGEEYEGKQGGQDGADGYLYEPQDYFPDSNYGILQNKETRPAVPDQSPPSPGASRENSLTKNDGRGSPNKEERSIYPYYMHYYPGDGGAKRGDNDYRNFVTYANQARNICLLLNDQLALLEYIGRFVTDKKLSAELEELIERKRAILDNMIKIGQKFSSAPINIKKTAVSRGGYKDAYRMLITLQRDLDRRLVALTNSRFSSNYTSLASNIIAADSLCKRLMERLKP